MMVASASDDVPFGFPALAARSCVFCWQPDEIITELRCGASRWLDAGIRAVNVSDGRDQPDDVAITLPDRLAKAVNKRKAEFLAGQLCATLSLEQLSGAILPLPRGADRSPQWPEGYLGSISHTDTRAIAVAARAADYRMLGIDLETLIDASRAEAVGPMVAKPHEWDLRPLAMTRADFLTVVFSAKEALYKAIYPSIRRIIEFSDVTLTVIGDDWLELELSPDIRAEHLAQTKFRLRYRISDGHCLSVLAVAHA